MTSFGVDVSSSGQAAIDWNRVAGSGIRFAIVRCVTETQRVDQRYAVNVRGALAAGLIVGSYAFLAGEAPVHQAELFIDAVGDPAGTLVALDIERPLAHKVPTARDVRLFVDRWRKDHPDHPIFLYGSRGSVLGSLGRLADLGPLWLAAYPTDYHEAPADLYALSGGASSSVWRSSFGGWKAPAIWQFAQTGKVPGIGGSVDLNAAEADFAIFLGGNMKLPTVPNQISYPGAGDADDCWVVATVWAALAAANGRARKPTVPQFRAAAGNPDNPRAIDGGNLDQIMKGAKAIWPRLDIVKYEAKDWPGFVAKLRAGYVASLAVLSSALPLNRRYGFGGKHQIGVAFRDGRLYMANPLQPNGSAPLLISEANLRRAALAVADGWVLAALLKPVAAAPAPAPAPATVPEATARVTLTVRGTVVYDATV